MSSIDLRPRLGRSPGRKASERFLFVCFFDPAGITTIYENIALWQQFSRYDIEVLNLWPGRGRALSIPETIDLDDYAGLIVHCTASHNPDNLYFLDRALARPFEQFDGVKILMKQDEHFYTTLCATYIGQKKFDLVITCVSPGERDKVYPRELVGDAVFLQAFTGYVSPYMRNLGFGSTAGRSFDIVYRGSIQALSFGRLGFEKRKIGYDVGRAAAGYPLTVDISSRWADRIGGTAWFDFLGHSRAVLGVESGANLFDFTGEVEAWCDAFTRNHPEADHLSEEFYNLADREFLHNFEGNVNYAQISPRHFEAAATRSVQILYEGEYSGVFVPNRHFVPLQRGLGNFAEVIDFIRDDKKTTEMTECAFEEIISEHQFHYETFVERFDEAVDNVLSAKGRKTPAAHPAAGGSRMPRALILAPHEPTQDPRIEWMAEGLSDNFEVCELGACAESTVASHPSYHRFSERRTRVLVERRRHDWVGVPGTRNIAAPGSVGIQHLTSLYVLADVPAKVCARSIGALDATDEDLGRFRWLARHFFHMCNALIEAGRLIGGFDVVVAADLFTLPAALVLAEEYGAAVVYDAHEFWPYSLMEFRHWEVEFWAAFERNLAPYADLRVTVSPQLAQIMSREYGCEFLSVPNCVSKRSVNLPDIEAALRRLAARDDVFFIFLGGFAPGRGLEDLIAAWRHVDKRARLVLQGPDDPFRTQMIELARSLALLDNGVSFPEAADPSELIEAARQADVGIIPYAASSINNRYCSPNKLSQYMAAGLPIICNETEFVKSIVLANGLGACVDFRDHQALARVVDRLVTSQSEIAEMSRRSRQYFETKFNWESVSGDLYARLGAAVRAKPVPVRADLDFSWIEQVREMRAEESGDGASGVADAEITRLNEFYSIEIARLNEVYLTEIARLNTVYPAEIARLNEVYSAEIARLNKVYQAVIAQLNATSVNGTRAAAASQRTRLLAGALLRCLPDRLRRPVRSGLGTLLHWVYLGDKGR